MFQDNIETIVNAPIYEMDSDFWDKIKTPYSHELLTLRENCEDIL